MNRYPEKNYLCDLAIAAGNIMLRYFQLDKKTTWKGDKTPVTVADNKINNLILGSLEKDFPNVSVISEEGSRLVPDAEYTLLCDPLDGTIPFIWGLPLSAVSLVLLKNQIPQISVIFDPFLKRMWVGEKGRKSVMNGNPVTVSKRKSLKRSNLCILFWPGADHDFSIVSTKASEAGAFCIQPSAVSYFGGLLASGDFDGIIFPGKDYWEAPAIELLVEGAGGITTDIMGEKITYNPNKKMKGMISSNGHMHSILLGLL